MAKMLGHTPYRTYSCFSCRCCGHTRVEHVIYRRNQRSRERAEVREIARTVSGAGYRRHAVEAAVDRGF